MCYFDKPLDRKLRCSDICCGWRRREAAEYDATQGNKRMRMEISRKRFNVDDYYRMADTGILAPHSATIVT